MVLALYRRKEMVQVVLVDEVAVSLEISAHLSCIHLPRLLRLVLWRGVQVRKSLDIRGEAFQLPRVLVDDGLHFLALASRATGGSSEVVCERFILNVSPRMRFDCGMLLRGRVAAAYLGVDGLFQTDDVRSISRFLNRRLWVLRRLGRQGVGQQLHLVLCFFLHPGLCGLLPVGVLQDSVHSFDESARLICCRLPKCVLHYFTDIFEVIPWYCHVSQYELCICSSLQVLWQLLSRHSRTRPLLFLIDFCLELNQFQSLGHLLLQFLFFDLFHLVLVLLPDHLLSLCIVDCGKKLVISPL